MYLNLANTVSKLVHNSSNECPTTMRSSRYAIATDSGIPRNTSSTTLQNVAGLFVRPKGRTVKRYCPRAVTNAVLSLSFGSNSTCQYPDAMSKVANQVAPCKRSKQS